LGDGLGGYGDEAVAGTDADGTGWPVHERTAPGLAAGAGNGDSRGASFAWLHKRYLPGSQAVLHEACGLIVLYA